VKNLTPTQQAFINMRVSQIKREILSAIIPGKPFYDGGPVPPLAISSFSELHDYTDANCLGGLCDDDQQGLYDSLFPGGEDRREWYEACDHIQTEVHNWLVTGRMSEMADFISSRMTKEQGECLLDPERNEEALGMVDDLEARVGAAFGFTNRACNDLRDLLDSQDDVALVAEHGMTSSDDVVKECSAKALTAIRTARDELCEAMKAAPPVTSMLLLHFIEEAAQLANAMEQFDAAIRE
jgi:hypothetical protein